MSAELNQAISNVITSANPILNHTLIGKWEIVKELGDAVDTLATAKDSVYNGNNMPEEAAEIRKKLREGGLTEEAKKAGWKVPDEPVTKQETPKPEDVMEQMIKRGKVSEKPEQPQDKVTIDTSKGSSKPEATTAKTTIEIGPNRKGGTADRLAKAIEEHGTPKTTPKPEKSSIPSFVPTGEIAPDGSEIAVNISEPERTGGDTRKNETITTDEKIDLLIIGRQVVEDYEDLQRENLKSASPEEHKKEIDSEYQKQIAACTEYIAELRKDVSSEALEQKLKRAYGKLQEAQSEDNPIKINVIQNEIVALENLLPRGWREREGNTAREVQEEKPVSKQQEIIILKSGKKAVVEGPVWKVVLRDVNNWLANRWPFKNIIEQNKKDRLKEQQSRS